MSDRKALEAAITQVKDQARRGTFSMGVPNPIWDAARERLAQLPEKCHTCDGTGETSTDGPPDICPVCHGSGKVYPAETVEKIARLIHSWDDRRNSRLSAVAVLDALGETP